MILDSIGEGVFAVNKDFKIIYLNKAARDITGFDAREAKGRYCYEIFRANICTRNCALRHTIETGEPLKEIRVEILNRANEEVPISVSTAILRSKSGAMLGGVEIFRDLSAIETLRREAQQRFRLQDMVGKSKAMQELFRLLPIMAASDATVLIQGPSGTGKELVAKALHDLGPRQRGPYERVNCGALPGELLESELFGHAKGAFTDAKTEKPGRFALAQGGTILLDEIGELPLQLQVKLLRVLQEKEIQPLGSVKTVKLNVRVLAATNKNLKQEVLTGKFREDLYFRLRVLFVEIPPLKQRKEDIPVLVDHLIKRISLRTGKTIKGVQPDVMELFLYHDFPGNVRELENVLEHAFVMCEEEKIAINHLPPDFLDQVEEPENSHDTVHRPSSTGEAKAIVDAQAMAETRAIMNALATTGGNKEKAARLLGISRTTLWRKMKKLDI
ncbi:MAG: PAS domain-containing protein [Deltaproteobacteria bacterium]|nr:PAS domain-containing protein [Deltaproteobacteria bacterium]